MLLKLAVMLAEVEAAIPVNHSVNVQVAVAVQLFLDITFSD